MAHVNEGSHSFTCHRHGMSHPAFNPAAAAHHRSLAGTHFSSHRG